MAYTGRCVCLMVCVVVFVKGQTSDNATGTTTTPSTPTKITTISVSTTTLTIRQECARLNSTDKPCETCVSNKKCLFCYKPEKCVPYPVGQLIPHSDICDLAQARWMTCIVNYKALLIAMGVLGCILVLSITCCCVYCCFCRGNKRARNKYQADEAKWETERENRKAQSQERRQERQSKLDDIRRKYGLMKDETASYQRFEES